MKVLKTDEELLEEINEFLENNGVLPSLKGFKYMADLILLMKKRKRFSKATIDELKPFIAEKYGIKEHSVQRQLRYAVTIANGLKDGILPIDLMSKAFYEIKLEKEN